MSFIDPSLLFGLCLIYWKRSCCTQCEKCNHLFSTAENLKQGNYFINIPIKQQIVSLLSDPQLFLLLTNRNLDDLENIQTVNDITTSALYKNLIESRTFSGNDLSLTWNTDGVSVFHSSNFSVWPLQVFLNELPPHLRSKNVLLAGLWFGEKPEMNTFLKPFVDECGGLQNHGFYFRDEIQPRKVIPLIFCADAPARAMVRNSKQYNGYYGCDWCETRGVLVEGRNVPYYSHRAPVTMRTAVNQAIYATTATPDNPVIGVKGISLMDMLPTFDTVKGVTTDYMRCVCLGVTKK